MSSHSPVQTGVVYPTMPLPTESPYLPSGQSLQEIAPGLLYDPLGHDPAHCREGAPGLSP